MNAAAGIPHEILARAQHYWQSLDELALNPEEYRKHLGALAKEFKAERLVKPGFVVFATGTLVNGTSQHALNIARSRAVPAQTDPNIMPVLLSNVRIFANYKGETWNVCDAVFNPTTLDRCDHDEAFMQEMLELALGCLKDTEGITYDKSTFRIEKDAYYGSYGWNDKTGESVGHTNPRTSTAEPPLRPCPRSDSEAAALNVSASFCDATAENYPGPDESILSELVIPSSASCPAAPSSGALIQEVEDASLGMPNPHVTDDSGGYSPSIKDPHSQISIEKASTDADTLDGQLERPLVAIKDLGARLKIVVMLPGVASSSEIDYRFARRHLRLKAGDRFQLDLQLPCDIVPASESGEYVKSKCRLNLFVSKVDP